jgi:PAS domain S-box-containing protein
MAGSPFKLFSRNRRLVLVAFILLFILLAGVWGFRERQSVIDNDIRIELVSQAVALSRTIRPDQVTVLSFTAADKDRTEFQRLRQQMIAYQSITNFRGIYTLALRDGQLIFGPESYADDDPQASPAGTVYEDPSEEDFAIFQTGTPLVQGPVEDEYGSFVSALAPVLDPRTGEVLLVVGIDIEAADHQAALFRQGVVGFIPALVLGAIALGGLLLTWRRESLPHDRRAHLRYVEVYAIAIFGLAASLVAGLVVSDTQDRSRANSFQQLAETKAQLVIKAFDNLQDHHLNSLVQFFTGSQFVERSEFHVFAEPLISQSAVEALEWVPYVPRDQKAIVEEQAHAEGLNDFSIWQFSDAGEREPVSQRANYYPILYIEPVQGNRLALGFDLGSDPVRRAALERAVSTGLQTASDIIVPVQGSEAQPSLLAIAPIFSANLLEQTQTGFVVGLVPLQPFLQSALFIGPASDESIVVDLYQLEADTQPYFLSSSSPSHTESHDGNEAPNELQSADNDQLAAFPLFIFDKSYALTIHEGEGQAAAFFTQAGPLTTIGGLLFTTLLTAFAGYVFSRRNELATQVEVRTAELRESEAHLTTLLDTLGDAVFITRMPDRNIEYVNRAVTDIFGYHEEELIGQTTERFYAPGVFSEYGQIVREAIAKQEHQVRSEVELRHKDGHQIWGEMNATIRYHGDQPESLFTVVRDITERILTRERIETQLQRLAALHNIDVAITSSLDLQTVLGVVLDQTTAHLRMDAALILLLDPETQELTYGAGRGLRSPLIQGLVLKLGESVAGNVPLTREMVHISNPAEDSRFGGNVWLKAEGFVEYFAAPLIAKGKVSGVLEIGHRSPFQPDDEWWGFLQTLGGEAAIAIDSARLLEDLQQANVNVVHAYDATIEGWSQALDLRDRETKGHTARVTQMTLELAMIMGIGDADLVHIRRGALLHDIGKIGIPDSILLKPGELTDTEWQLMRKHPRFAFDMLSPIAYLLPALDIPFCHHEKWDGTGYPRGLKGEQIPLAARIFAVVDVYDALISDRPYRKSLSKNEALAYIRGQSGKHFDPAVVEVFLAAVAS